MNQKFYLPLEIASNERVAVDAYRMVFFLPTDVKAVNIQPGQFVNVCLPDKGHLVPRPFSVLDAQAGKLSILYKIFGKGTQLLSQQKPGTILNVLLPLGNMFPDMQQVKTPLVLVGGGVGVPPLYFVVKRLHETNPSFLKNVTFYMGAAKAEGLLLVNELERLGCNVVVSTDDGSAARTGNCVQALKEDITAGKQVHTIFSCGPHGMLKAVYQYAHEANIDAYLSVEEVMGCGFGACVGCVVPVKHQEGEMPYQLACINGPVFHKDVINW